jgi:hypothetical protein
MRQIYSQPKAEPARVKEEPKDHHSTNRAPLREDTINLSPITPAGSQTGAQNGTGRSRLSRTMRNTRTLHGSNGQMPDKNSPICSTKIELKRESGVKQEYKENEYVRIKMGLY